MIREIGDVSRKWGLEERTDAQPQRQAHPRVMGHIEGLGGELVPTRAVRDLGYRPEPKALGEGLPGAHRCLWSNGFPSNLADTTRTRKLVAQRLRVVSSTS